MSLHETDSLTTYKKRKKNSLNQKATEAQKTNRQKFQWYRFVKELNIFHFYRFNRYRISTHIN